MNLKQMRERCEKIAALNEKRAHPECSALGITEEITKTREAFIRDIPALLSWVERAKKAIGESLTTPYVTSYLNTETRETFEQLLAEVEDNE